MDKAIYLNCLTCFDAALPIEGTGIDNQNPLFLHGFLDIAAVVSVVSLDEFCGPSAESRLQDLAWVGPRACRHQEIVERVMRYTPVLPAHFGTLFSSFENLEKLLHKNYDNIRRFLDHMKDKEEWSVKVLLDREKAKEERIIKALAREAEQLASLTPGKRYFQEQRIRTDVEKELNSWLKEVCEKTMRDLNSFAADFYDRKSILHGVNGSDGVIIQNWAFLVPQIVKMDFQARIDLTNADLSPQGLVFELSGPWPPYSFSPDVK